MDALRLMAFVAIAASGCAKVVCEPRPPSEREAVVAARSPGTLSVLTWNIWMMPRWTGESPENDARARAIAEVLRREYFDVMCLEKAFDGRARDAIAAALASDYPHRYGPVNLDGSFITMNGGVWVLSRNPMKLEAQIQYDDCDDVECFSRKGAMLLSGEIDHRPFQLIATHLQGDDTPEFNPPHQRVREAQLRQLAKELLPRARADVPLVYCGDFSTRRFTSFANIAETSDYRDMLSTLSAENGPAPRITLKDDCTHNDLATDDTYRWDEMDYILLRQPRSGPRITGAWREIVFERTGWDAMGHRDLSYRHAVAATFHFPAPAR
jgi:endonuclease/exonuclease/phosphatase family metal-dependent hydrolase